MKTKSTKGFTLIELIITLAIIAVLLLIATSSYRKHVSDANETLIISDTNKMSTAIKSEILHDKKPLSERPISRLMLGNVTVYSGRQKELGLPNEKLYNIENPRKHLNTTLKGQFVATADGEAYYLLRKPSTKPNTGIVTPPLPPPVCPEEELNKLNGNYRIIMNPDYTTYIQESSGSLVKIDLRCLKGDTFINNIIYFQGPNGVEQLSVAKDPIIQVIKQEGNIITLQDKDGNTGKIDISEAEIFTENQPLQDKAIQVKLKKDTIKAEIINILPDIDYKLQGTIQDLMVDAPMVKENKTELAMISSDDIFRSSTTNSMRIYTEHGSLQSVVVLYTNDTDLLDKLEGYLKQNGEKAKIQVKYEYSNRETYKTILQLEVLTSDGYKDIKTL